MPARIVLVHDELEFLTALESRLRGVGYDVAIFEDSLSAFDALSSSERVEILITRVRFRPGQPHGISLAQAGRMRRPSLKVIFTAAPEMAEHARDHGMVFIMPVDPDQVVKQVEEFLTIHLQ